MEERPIKALKVALISQNSEITREIAQNAKGCSKRKKLLEIQEVAKKLPSKLWKALITMAAIAFFMSRKRKLENSNTPLFLQVF